MLTIEYLCVILGASDMDDLIDTFGDDLIETFLDKACTYLYDEQGWSVYRPLYVDGVYTEKPYELEGK